jgi:hypothetical protein
MKRPAENFLALNLDPRWKQAVQGEWNDLNQIRGMKKKKNIRFYRGISNKEVGTFIGLQSSSHPNPLRIRAKLGAEWLLGAFLTCKRHLFW